MNTTVHQDAAATLEYTLLVQEAVVSAADDDELTERVEEFDGGSPALLAFLADGMALAFDPSRSGGETGVVQFVVALPSGEVEVWMHVEPDRCYATDSGDDPDAVIWLALPVFLRIAFKRIDGADAYLAGLVRAVGDVVLATSIDDWFAPPVLTAREHVS